jgi:putative endonuclease
MAKWFVYFLKCRDGSLYTGITNDLDKRFNEHMSGRGSKYVRSRKAKKIVYIENFPTKSGALKREAELKHLSRQRKLELIKYWQLKK